MQNLSLSIFKIMEFLYFKFIEVLYSNIFLFEIKEVVYFDFSIFKAQNTFKMKEQVILRISPYKTFFFYKL